MYCANHQGTPFPYHHFAYIFEVFTLEICCIHRPLYQCQDTQHWAMTYPKTQKIVIYIMKIMWLTNFWSTLVQQFNYHAGFIENIQPVWILGKVRCCVKLFEFQTQFAKRLGHANFFKQFQFSEEKKRILLGKKCTDLHLFSKV